MCRDTETGRFLPANLAALTHGQRSRQLLDVPALAEAHRARVEAIEADLGGAAQVSAVQLPLVSELARLQLITAGWSSGGPNRWVPVPSVVGRGRLLLHCGSQKKPVM